MNGIDGVPIDRKKVGSIAHYEHFRDKEDILTQLAIEGQLCLAKELARELPKAPDAAVLLMVERYWSFMLKRAVERYSQVSVLRLEW
jgi:AcrR family transcriptional regulator